jgi:hypothetical protein
VPVELVSVVGVLVGVLLDELDEVSVVVVGVLVVVDVVDVVVLEVDVDELQFEPASSLTVLAACCRLSVSRGLTPPRLSTAPARPPAALVAEPH